MDVNDKLETITQRILGYDLYGKKRTDGSIYYTCEALPGFHYILAPGERALSLTLAPALSGFLSLWEAAHAEVTPRGVVAEVYEDLAKKREMQIAALFDAIAHGTDEHRSWLKKAIDDHFAGRPVEAPRG